MSRHDVAIVGAGPAGSTLAVRLARAGHSVLLIDGARFPRAKVCGEGIMPAGVAALEELGLRASLAEHAEPFAGIRYRLPDGTSAEASFPGGAQGWGIDRRVLDERLLAAARREPLVTLRLGEWVREHARGPDGVRLRVGDEEHEAALLVGADGVRSRVRREAGLDRPLPRSPRFGVGGHFLADRGETGQVSRVEVFVAPGLELYTTPVAPDVTCAALLVDRAGLAPLQGDLEGGLRRLLREAGGRCARLAAGELLGPVKALGPLALGARAAHAERLVLVGDAAGALDPITGEGLTLALTTNRIAAEVLHEALRRGDGSARALAAWTRQRGRKARPLAGFTQVVLRMAARPARAARVIRSLAGAPDTFGRLLGVASGMAPLSSLTFRDGLRVLLGV